LLTTVPFTPAGLGVVEAAIVTVLLPVINDAGLAGSVALLDRTITYWSLVLIGAVVYLFSGNK
ncbi:MAG: lysylphosphatidylglycerol synthase domain-containing protein, partial [Chloroflexota bacterium]|nr:lysylphosphatidylglycerol synthase domain-containing protein [Chloroflexota bacterium]